MASVRARRASSVVVEGWSRSRAWPWIARTKLSSQPVSARSAGSSRSSMVSASSPSQYAAQLSRTRPSRGPRPPAARRQCAAWACDHFGTWRGARGGLRGSVQEAAMAGSAKPCGFAAERWLASPYRLSCGVWPARSSSIPSTGGRGGLTVSRSRRGSVRCQGVEDRTGGRSAPRVGSVSSAAGAVGRRCPGGIRTRRAARDRAGAVPECADEAVRCCSPRMRAASAAPTRSSFSSWSAAAAHRAGGRRRRWRGATSSGPGRGCLLPSPGRPARAVRGCAPGRGHRRRRRCCRSRAG